MAIRRSLRASQAIQRMQALASMPRHPVWRWFIWSLVLVWIGSNSALLGLYILWSLAWVPAAVAYSLLGMGGLFALWGITLAARGIQVSIL